MTTFRAAVAKWALPLVGLYLLLIGLVDVFHVAVPDLLIGIVAFIAGLACLFAS